jgi:hypothetical protein
MRTPTPVGTRRARPTQLAARSPAVSADLVPNPPQSDEPVHPAPPFQAGDVPGWLTESIFSKKFFEKLARQIKL